MPNVFLFGVGGGGSDIVPKTLTANGTYNATDEGHDGYSPVTVNVSGGGSSSHPSFCARTQRSDWTMLFQEEGMTALQYTGTALNAGTIHTQLVAAGYENFAAIISILGTEHNIYDPFGVATATYDKDTSSITYWVYSSALDYPTSSSLQLILSNEMDGTWQFYIFMPTEIYTENLQVQLPLPFEVRIADWTRYLTGSTDFYGE